MTRAQTKEFKPKTQNSCGGLPSHILVNLYRIIDSELKARKWGWENIEVDEFTMSVRVHGAVDGKSITPGEKHGFLLALERRVLS